MNARSAKLLFTVAVSAACFTTHADTYHTPPDPSMHGGITGVIEPAAKLQRVIAFEPYEQKAYQAKIELSSGRFTFHGLPPGEYDLFVKTVGHVYEGLTLELEPDAAPGRSVLDTIVQEVGREFFATEDYFNLKHIVRLTASEGPQLRARMFVVQTRTKAVVDPGGNPIRGHIRRFDFVDLVKTRDVWQITASQHLLRQEVPKGSADTNIELSYSPRLGGILVGETVRDVGTIDLKNLPEGPADQYGSAKHEGP